MLGKTFLVMALLMCLPLIVVLSYGEVSLYGDKIILAFLIPTFGLLCTGLPLSLMKVKDKSLYAKEGFVIVALIWLIVSVVGCVPFLISQVIPNFFDAFFETVSGFSTTGASILTLENNSMLYLTQEGLWEVMPKSIMFWRVFTHWIGGMGVLVFLLAILPSNGNNMHIFRAETPGPSSSKLVSKIKQTAIILYLIYLILSAIMVFFLLFGGLDLYESLLAMFSTAGTGGLAIYGNSIQHYNSVYIEMVIAVFMMLFGINFNVYYMVLIGKAVKGIKSEELFTYFLIIIASTVAIAINIISITGNFWTSLRYSFFQTTSIISTTGFASVNFDNWPALSKGILIFLTIVGACGGSTGGGIKLSRMIILAKSSVKDIKKSLRARSVNCVMFEGQALDREVERNVRTYFIMWVGIVIASTLLLSLDTFGDIYANFASTLACIGNVGPVISDVIGSMGNYSGYNWFSKLVLSFVMLAGRLEIFPLIILFTPRTWKRGK